MESQTDRHFRECEVDPPNGVYPTLDDWTAALAELHRSQSPLESGLQARAISGPGVSARSRNSFVTPRWTDVDTARSVDNGEEQWQRYKAHRPSLAQTRTICSTCAVFVCSSSAAVSDFSELSTASYGLMSS